MKKNIGLLCTILCGIFFLGTIGILISMKDIDKKTEQNTTQFVGTIGKIEVTNTGKNISVVIYTQEKENMLYISTDVGKRINMDRINRLEEGETIFVRIENNMLTRFEETGFANIVALKTAENDIYSLKNYNEYIRSSACFARMSCVFFSVAFLLATIYFALRIIRSHTNG